MVEAVPFKAEHLTQIVEDGLLDKKLKPWITHETAPAMEKRGDIYSVLDEGRAVAVGGIIEYWVNRGEAWLIFGKTNTRTFVIIFKMVQRFLELSTLKRIEMVIDYDFVQGHRWARLLGFKKEAELLKHYRPDGGDVSLYSKVRA